jgi:hypothetical protein
MKHAMATIRSSRFERNTICSVLLTFRTTDSCKDPFQSCGYLRRAEHVQAWLRMEFPILLLHEGGHDWSIMAEAFSSSCSFKHRTRIRYPIVAVWNRDNSSTRSCHPQPLVFRSDDDKVHDPKMAVLAESNNLGMCRIHAGGHSIALPRDMIRFI